MAIWTDQPTDWHVLDKGDILKLVSQQYSTSVRYILVAGSLVNQYGDIVGYDCWVLKPSMYNSTSELTRQYVTKDDIENEFQPTDDAELMFRWNNARDAQRQAVFEAEIQLLKAKAADAAFELVSEELWGIL